MISLKAYVWYAFLYVKKVLHHMGAAKVENMKKNLD